MNNNIPQKPEVTLKRTLGLFASTLMVVGIVIGSGVFKKIVPMAQTGLSETSILIAWIVAGLILLSLALQQLRHSLFCSVRLLIPSYQYQNH
jgi:amino acid transporter